MTGTGDARSAQTLYVAAEARCGHLNDDLARWQEVNRHELAALNSLLEKNGKKALPVTTPPGLGCTP